MSSSLFTPTFYQISIASSTGAAPNDGFVDAVRVENYLTVNSDNLPSDFTLALSLAKKRANKRYKQIVQQLQLVANMYVSKGQTLGGVTYSNIVATGASYKTEASNITFTVTVERGDSVLTTPDELNVGSTLTGLAAIKRSVARAMSTDLITTTEVYDPTKLPTPGNVTNLPRFGYRTQLLTVGKCAIDIPTSEALITITVASAP